MKFEHIVLIGEVLFDCFPDGHQVLGGAPFNVAWHLQALGDQPYFISRVGKDELGQKIIEAMQGWGMTTTLLQRDTDANIPTGKVEVAIVNNEPHYDIVANCAYDYITAPPKQSLPQNAILYHGSLALRSEYAKIQFNEIFKDRNYKVFIDVNLRPPWWEKESLFTWLKHATWAKLNEAELRQLGFGTDFEVAMKAVQSEFELEQLIVTRGSEGAWVREQNGTMHHMPAPQATKVVDTVGAGDAFTAIYLHGLLNGWPIDKTLSIAQYFASKIVEIRGAVPTNSDFYRGILDNKFVL